jgi:hypothetical protein
MGPEYVATAYSLVPDARIRAQIAGLVTRMLENLLAGGWNVVLPDRISTTFLIRPDQQLALMQTRGLVNPSKYAGQYARMAAALAFTAPIPAGP